MIEIRTEGVDRDAGQAPIQLGLLLVDGFAMLSYASVIEPFRAANVLAGKRLYEWRHLCVDGVAVAASNGAVIQPDEPAGARMTFDTVYVIASGDPTRFNHAPTFAWLRRLAAAHVRLAGISGGPLLLAKAGLLHGHRATIHWDYRAVFEASFPDLALDTGLYVIDRRRITCAGGAAGLDLAIEIIEREQGPELARQVSDWFIRTDLRAGDRPQRLSLRERFGVRDARLLKALALMEANLEQPLGREQLAAAAACSVRQLDRLFTGALGRSAADIYREIRLAHARELLRKTGLPTTAIGLACGFLSSSHFAQAFRQRYGMSPTAARSPSITPGGTRSFGSG